MSFEAADAIVLGAVEREEIPGAVLHVRAHGRVLHERAFGRRSVDADQALAVDGLFAVASLTKLVVAAAVLQLCEDGRLSVDDPIERHLPGFARPSVLVGYDPDTTALTVRPAAGSITVRHLLTHTAGIHHGFPQVDRVLGTIYERAGVRHDDGQSLAEKIACLGPLPLAHDPGAAWTYGLSSDVAGRLVEVISGEPLDRQLARRVFEPLGMRSTYFFVPPAERHRVVARHVRDRGRAALAPWKERDGERYPSGGGGLYTTVGDYARLVQALLDGGTPILSRESVVAMTSNQIGALTALGLKYGLSVGLATADARGQSPLPLGGFGWYGIYSTWFWTLPRHGAAVLLFGNILDTTMSLPLFSRIAGTIEAALG